MKKRRKKSHRLYASVVLILGIAIIFMAFRLLFHVHKIQIVGNEYVESNEIAETIRKDKFATNTVYLVVKGKMGGFDFSPAVEQVKISFTAPWGVKLTVKEKEIAGSVIQEGEYCSFDKDGFVVYKNTIPADNTVHIEGPEFKKIKLYKQLPVKDKTFVKSVGILTKSLKENKLEPDHILYGKSGFTLKFNEITVKLGKDNLQHKVKSVKPFIKKIKDKKGTINLTHFTKADTKITLKLDEK